jgi:hypothetical protein
LAYLFLLISAGAFLFYVFPVPEIFSGLMSLADSSALTSVVSFAQWILSGGIFKYTVLFIVMAPFPLSLLFSLLFAGAFGSFASGMEEAGGFPAKPGVGFFSGYGMLFMRVLPLFIVTFAVILSTALIWVIAAVPLAVIKALEERGAFSAVVFNVTLAVTALAAYAGLLFIRICPMAVITALYSGSYRPIRDSLSFLGHNFFKAAKYFLISDVVIFFLVSLYSFFNNSLYVLLINCFVISVLIFFLIFVIFDTYAAGGYGYDESGGAAYDGEDIGAQ